MATKSIFVDYMSLHITRLGTVVDYGDKTKTHPPPWSLNASGIRELQTMWANKMCAELSNLDSKCCGKMLNNSLDNFFILLHFSSISRISNTSSMPSTMVYSNDQEEHQSYLLKCNFISIESNNFFKRTPTLPVELIDYRQPVLQ